MNSKKSQQLGIDFGTASHRLRKLILFHLVKESGRDTCFKCGARIQSVDEMSIEHKVPWQDNSPELFWDMENIAFSHLRCNLRHNNPGGKSTRKIGPTGTSWCSGCKSFKSTDNFSGDAHRWNKLNKYCKPCLKLKNCSSVV